MSLAAYIMSLPPEWRDKFRRERWDRFLDGKMDLNELGVFMQDILDAGALINELPRRFIDLAQHYVNMGVCTIGGRGLQ